MVRAMRRWLLRRGTALVLHSLAALARVDGKGRARGQQLIAAFGHAMANVRGIKGGPRTPAELGGIWQTAFAAKKHVPILRVDDTTAYGEILTPCPLRGSGDLTACHRMMGYDRAFLARADAHLVVLRSQVEPGVTTCLVAIRVGAHGTAAPGLAGVRER
jgi:hypothetical protein